MRIAVNNATFDLDVWVQTSWSPPPLSHSLHPCHQSVLRCVWTPITFTTSSADTFSRPSQSPQDCHAPSLASWFPLLPQNCPVFLQQPVCKLNQIRPVQNCPVASRHTVNKIPCPSLAVATCTLAPGSLSPLPLPPCLGHAGFCAFPPGVLGICQRPLPQSLLHLHTQEFAS